MNRRTTSVGSGSLRAHCHSMVNCTIALRLSIRASKCRLRSTSGRPQSRRTKHNICALRKASSSRTISTSCVCSSAPRHRRRSQFPLLDSPAMHCCADYGQEHSSESYCPPPLLPRPCRLPLRSPEKVKAVGYPDWNCCRCMTCQICQTQRCIGASCVVTEAARG